MKICILIFSCGRNEYLSETLKSFNKNVMFPKDAELYKILIDDMPEGRDEEFLRGIQQDYSVDHLILNETNTGISASVQKAWSLVPLDCDYIWHQEDDFIFNKEIDIKKFSQILSNKIIFQVTCLRQPWFKREKEYGGIYQSEPSVFKDAHVMDLNIVVHREYFSQNPGLYRRDVIAQTKDYNEYNFKDYLLKTRGHGYFAYWGKLTDEPLVHHIGEEKKGIGQI